MDNHPHHLRRLMPPLPASFVIGPPTPQQMADSLLAESMQQMSLHEREQVLEEVHGVARVVAEEPHFVNTCLARVQYELDSIPNTHHMKQAYAMALALNADYVLNRKFRLLFLRSESFQPQAAALRILGFLFAKLDLFGPEKLCRDILVSDLDDADKVCLESGYLQLLPGRDRSGRPVVFCSPDLAPPTALPVHKLRTLYYLFMTALEDDDSQRCGIVVIVYSIGKHRPVDREAVWKNAMLMNRMPVKFAGFHYCSNNDPALQFLFSLGITLVEARTRTRTRAHIGSAVECMYKLLSFGITNEILPISTNGKLKPDNHYAFLERRRLRDGAILSASQRQRHPPQQQHQQQPPSPIRQPKPPTQLLLFDPNEERVVVPRPLDVLLGRGRHFHSKLGNRRLQNLIDEYAEHYDRSSTLEKTTISGIVVRIIKEPELEQQQQQQQQQLGRSGGAGLLSWGGGRFLEQDEFGWKVLDDDMARGRVSHKFRNLRLKPSESPSRPTTTANNNKNNDLRRRQQESTGNASVAPHKGKGKALFLATDTSGMTDGSSSETSCWNACKRQKLP